MIVLFVILIVSLLISFLIRNMLKFFFITASLVLSIGIALFIVQGLSNDVWISSQNQGYELLKYTVFVFLVFLVFYGIEQFCYAKQIEIPLWLKIGKKPPSTRLEVTIYILIVILIWLVYQLGDLYNIY